MKKIDKILITGASGHLGKEIIKELNGHELLTPTHQELDFLQPLEVYDYALLHMPDWIINCAAYTQVDKAETDPMNCFIINRDSVISLSNAAADYGGKLLHISTNYVFDGLKSKPYVETDAAYPLSIYGQSKLEGERIEGIVLRTGWHTHKMNKLVIDSAYACKPLRIVADRIGSPTWADDIAKAIGKLITLPYVPGIYHYTNDGPASWYQFACGLLECAGLKADITPITSADWPEKAKRPMYSVLDTTKIQKLIGPIKHWRNSLEETYE